MGRVYTASLRGDGLIVVRPRRIAFKMPVRGFVLLMAMLMLFKGFLLGWMGDAAYQERLDVLRQGSPYEAAGAFVMGVDPVTRVIADSLGTIIR